MHVVPGAKSADSDTPDNKYANRRNNRFSAPSDECLTHSQFLLIKYRNNEDIGLFYLPSGEKVMRFH